MLEHAMSQDLENAIEKLLNFPTKDPFGQEIPGSKKTKKEPLIPLSESSINNTYKISTIPPENSSFVEFLYKNNIIPGTEITIDEIEAAAGLFAKRFLISGDLSFGQQKLLEFAMALMNEPKVILLDEPTAGINPTLINGLIDRLIKANQELYLQV